MGKRKLSTAILIVFLFLIAISSSTIIFFTYARNNKLIRKLAEGTIDRVSMLIVDRVECMLNAMSVLPRAGAAFHSRHPDEKAPNELALNFLLDGLQAHSNLYAYYLGTPNGSAIITFNLGLTGNPDSLRFSSRPAPPETAFAAIVVDRNQDPPTETWLYFNKSLEKISSENIPFRGYDPRVRPWYKGAQEAGKLYWTDVFTYDPTDETGIAVSTPVYNKAGELVFVYGADLSLKVFENFLKEQKIGAAGVALILDASGKIIIPSHPHRAGLQTDTLSAAYKTYQVEKKKNFSFSFEDTEYLAAVYTFPPSFNKNWTILIVDPISDYFAEAFKTEHQVVLISLAILLVAALLVAFFSKHISAPIVTLSQEVDKITRLELDSNRRVESNILEISKMDNSIADLRKAIRSFSRYAPREIVKELMLKGKDTVLGGEKKEITILFTDITEFTPVAESYPIETVTSLLAEYFDLLSKIILKQHGTIDKYIGDGIMAFWGAPEERTDHARLACLTALQCQAALAKLNREREEKKLPPFYTRIGINTGDVIVGNLGTTERINYTVIGDAVNAAARIEELNKVYRTQILISEAVVAKIGAEFRVRPIDTVELQGKKKKIKIFELLGLENMPSH